MANISLYLEIPKPNQDTFGKRILKSCGPKIWNALPYHMIKTSENLNCFKAIIKCWDGNHCTCRACKHTTYRRKEIENKTIEKKKAKMINSL